MIVFASLLFIALLSPVFSCFAYKSCFIYFFEIFIALFHEEDMKHEICHVKTASTEFIFSINVIKIENILRDMVQKATGQIYTNVNLYIAIEVNENMLA